MTSGTLSAVYRSCFVGIESGRAESWNREWEWAFSTCRTLGAVGLPRISTKDRVGTAGTGSGRGGVYVRTSCSTRTWRATR